MYDLSVILVINTGIERLISKNWWKKWSYILALTSRKVYKEVKNERSLGLVTEARPFAERDVFCSFAMQRMSYPLWPMPELLWFWQGHRNNGGTGCQQEKRVPNSIGTSLGHHLALVPLWGICLFHPLVGAIFLTITQIALLFLPSNQILHFLSAPLTSVALCQCSKGILLHFKLGTSLPCSPSQLSLDPSKLYDFFLVATFVGLQIASCQFSADTLFMLLLLPIKHVVSEVPTKFRSGRCLKRLWPTMVNFFEASQKLEWGG